MILLPHKLRAHLTPYLFFFIITTSEVATSEDSSTMPQNSAAVTPSLQCTPPVVTSPNAPFSPINNTRSALSQVDHLSDVELQARTSVLLQTLCKRGLSIPVPLTVTPPKSDMYNNAYFEQIACAGLSQKYDGTPDPLIPTLNLIHLRRQNKVWYEATFMSVNGVKNDLVHQFSKNLLSTIKDQAKQLWSLLDAPVQRHTCGICLYNSSLFGLFLLNSLTPDFAALLDSRIDQTYSSNGPLLFLTMCNHVHRNHLAFVESIKNKICLSTLSEHNNDIASYLHFLQDNLLCICKKRIYSKLNMKISGETIQKE